MSTAITSDLLLRAYAAGIFPMADADDSHELFWVDPERRGILPLENFHLPRRLRRTVRSDVFDVVCDQDFDAVIQGCGEPATDRPKTWINSEIRRLYTALYRRGFAHTVECRLEGVLVGGLYGVMLGGAFFGESMFSRVTDASKVALAHLVARLRIGQVRLLDTQFVTTHLTQFGAVEIPREAYHRLLTEAIAVQAYFPGGPLDGEAVTAALQSSRLTS